MEKTYKKGDRVTLKDGNSTRMATVTADGMDSQKRVRVRPDNFPMDMSVTTMQSGNIYVIEKMAKGSTINGGGIELEDKVKIVANLEDHEGYKGQVVEVIGYDDMGYLTVESSDGTQWYVGEEEVKLVKKGSGKHEAEIRKQSAKAKKDIQAMRSAIGGEVNYFKFVSSKTTEYRKEGYSLVDAIDTAFRDLGLETGGKFEKKEFDDLLKSNPNVKKAWNQYKQNSEIYLENGYYVNPYQGQYAKGSTVKGGFKLGDKVKVIRGANKGEKGVVSNTDSDFFGDYTINVRGHKLSGFKADDLIKYANGGGVGDKMAHGGMHGGNISTATLEEMVGRKLNGWNDDVVYFNGDKYQKLYLQPFYVIA